MVTKVNFKNFIMHRWCINDITEEEQDISDKIEIDLSVDSER